MEVSTTLIEENASRGTSVARLIGFDPDAGEVLSFSLLSVESNGVLIDDLFVVENDQLLLASDASDFDADSFDVALRVSDQSGSFYDEYFTFSLVPTITLSNDRLAGGLPPLVLLQPLARHLMILVSVIFHLYLVLVPPIMIAL